MILRSYSCCRGLFKAGSDVRYDVVDSNGHLSSYFRREYSFKQMRLALIKRLRRSDSPVCVHVFTTDGICLMAFCWDAF